MEARSAGDIFLFEGLRLDRRGLFQWNQSAPPTPIEIGSRALEVLRVLIERPGDLLSRAEIMAAAWPGIMVENNNLNVQISMLRRVFGQHGAQGGCIQTAPGRGYRFVAAVTRSDANAHAVTRTSSEGGEHSRPRLSIVVLPFAYIGNDLDQQYFADGITDDVTTDLSRIVDMLVISRHTAFTYRNKPIDTKQSAASSACVMCWTAPSSDQASTCASPPS